MKRCITLIFLSCLLLSVRAQELQCNVTINTDMIEGSNKQVFNTLRQAIEEYVNTTRWTGLTFSEPEKIECNMMLVVKSYADNQAVCEFTVQSRRPVYGTSYSTPLVNFKDNNFIFTYQEYDPLEYQDHVFTTNLTAMLAYYCYLIIGYDMDSFGRLGGTPYFQQCEDIVTAAQTASLTDAEMAGWKAFDSNRNRYAVVNNLMDEAFKPFRNYFYTYHRLCLDQMAQNVANARARILEEMPVLKEVNRARPQTFVINTFLDAKAEELVNIFKNGTSQEKQKAYDLLMDLDPTRSNTYDDITR